MISKAADGVRDRLYLEPLRIDQYRQVAEWEFGEQSENTDWQRYIAEMNAPQWAHLGLYGGADFIGCISLERIDPQTMAYHVVTDRHRVHPRALAQVLLKMADELFKQGHTALTVRIPSTNRAAARLAIRCGMTETGRNESERHFILTRS